MIYKSIDILEFPKTEEGWKLAKELSEKTLFILTEKEDVLELRAEHWNTIEVEK